MKKLWKKLFGNKGCRLSYCRNKPTETLRVIIESEVIKFDYCRKHAWIADELFKNKEIKLDAPYNYKKLE